MQQGHRDSVDTRAAFNLLRTVAIEFGTCRSGRNGGSPRSISFGNCSFLEQLVEAVSEGGNRFSLGDQKSVGGNAQCCVMVEATPASPLEVAKANFLFEFVVVALNAPAQLDDIDERDCREFRV